MPGNNVRTTLKRALGAVFIGLALTGTALAQQPLKIGFGMSLTGPLAGNGKAALIAMELWRDDVNAKGGILGRKVEFVYYDDQTTPATVAGIYTKLLDVDKTHPPNPVDYSPIVRAIQVTNPEVVFVASYPPDSAGMVRAANEVGLKTRMFGGGLVGPQFAALKTQLGPLLNGVVNYEFYAPDLGSKFPFLDQFLARYQARAAKESVEPLGFSLPPYAYALMQALDQAITATKGHDQAKLAEDIHKNTFDTYVGKVGFAKNGEWAAPRVMMTQYHGIVGNDVEQFKKPGRLTVLSPKA